MKIQIEITKFERDSIETPLYVARANALLELQKAKGRGDAPVIEWCQARFTTLDRIIEALGTVE